MLKCQFENGHQASLRHVVVDAIVLNQSKTQVLLAKRSPKISEGGKWSLIGGYVERNETLIEAVKREIGEETGFEISEPELFKIIDQPDRPHEDRQNIALVYVCQTLSKVGEADWESTQQKWFDLTALPDQIDFAFDHGLSLIDWLTTQT